MRNGVDLNHCGWLAKTCDVTRNEARGVCGGGEAGLLRVGGVSSRALPPLRLHCSYLGRRVLITAGLRRSQLGDEARVSLIKVAQRAGFLAVPRCIGGRGVSIIQYSRGAF